MICHASHGVEIFGASLTVVLLNEVANRLWQFRLSRTLHAVAHVINHDLRTLNWSKSVVRVHAILVFGEERGILNFSHIVIERASTHQLHIGIDG